VSYNWKFVVNIGNREKLGVKAADSGASDYKGVQGG
jgi:hypothetical protein